MATKDIIIHLDEGSGQTSPLGFVFLTAGGTFKDLREQIILDKLVSSDFVFLGGSRMLPIGAYQEERWEVQSGEVTIQLRDENGSPCKRPRVEVSSRNEPCPLSLEVPKKDLHTPNVSGDVGLCEDMGAIKCALKSMLTSSLATPTEVKKWERDLKAAKEKLQAIGRCDRFELMSKDKDGKAMFQIWCNECECSYGKGGHDTISNFIHSHINTMAHLRRVGLYEQNNQRHDQKVEPSKEEIMARNKEKVDEAMVEVSSFGIENNVTFDMVSETIGDYMNLSPMYIKCTLDNRWLPLFPKTGSLHQCMIEHLKSKLHIKAISDGLDEHTKKVGRPSKTIIEDKRQRNLHGFFKPNDDLGKSYTFY